MGAQDEGVLLTLVEYSEVGVGVSDFGSTSTT